MGLKAAANDHLSVVKFLHENPTEGCTKYTMDDAAAQSYLKIVKYLYENRTEGCTPRAMDKAAKNGTVPVNGLLEILSRINNLRILHIKSFKLDIACCQLLPRLTNLCLANNEDCENVLDNECAIILAQE
ncbi:hypothetical protein THRCLA_20536 [Thraustotheca clavata]|uniref:Uncharacterized protein n=1 Tax=Thraustotheca clavata TaxID=74557 RepID=A0A1W0A657_9STRA|nr:hypothetical protein THRCLA_20536 [Thraustotheca clavata]